MSTYADEQGQWHALRQGMPVPSTAIDDNPLISFCFNEAWHSPVITALKLLTRPEAWTGSDSDIRAAVLEAQTLLGMAQSGCGGASWPINWYLDYTVGYGNIDTDAWLGARFGVYPGGTGWIKYDLVMWGTGTGGIDVTVKGRELSTGDHVGGHFAHAAITNQSDPAGQTFVATTVDCLGNTVVHTDFTPRDYPGDLQTIRFVTGNVTVFWMKFLIEGDWLCAGI